MEKVGGIGDFMGFYGWMRDEGHEQSLFDCRAVGITDHSRRALFGGETGMAALRREVDFNKKKEEITPQ